MSECKLVKGLLVFKKDEKDVCLVMKALSASEHLD